MWSARVLPAGTWSVGRLLKLSLAFRHLQDSRLSCAILVYILGVKFLWVELQWLQQPVWGWCSTGEAKVGSEFSGQHNRGISVLPTCSEQPEGQRSVGSWIWPAVQIPAGLSHGTVHRGPASQWSETAEFLESHEHLSVEKTRVGKEKQAGIWKKLDERHRKNVTSKALLKTSTPYQYPYL